MEELLRVRGKKAEGEIFHRPGLLGRESLQRDRPDPLRDPFPAEAENGPRNGGEPDGTEGGVSRGPVLQGSFHEQPAGRPGEYYRRAAGAFVPDRRCVPHEGDPGLVPGGIPGGRGGHGGGAGVLRVQRPCLERPHRRRAEGVPERAGGTEGEQCGRKDRGRQDQRPLPGRGGYAGGADPYEGGAAGL